MPSVPLRCALLLGVATTLLAGVLTTPAGAVTRPDFDLAAIGGDVYPRFSAAPGETVRGAVRLESRSDRTSVVRLEATDLVTASQGGIDFASRRPAATGAWLRLDRRDVVLPAGEATTVGFTASVPEGAAAGEHYAGIVAIDRDELRRTKQRQRSGRNGVVLHQLSRLALPVRLDLAGRAERRLAVGDLHFATNAGGSRLELDLRSAGRLLVRSTDVDLRVSRDGKELLRHRGTLSEFVPATRIRYPLPWSGRPVRGEYRVTGTIKPAGAPAIAVDERAEFQAREARRLEEQTGDAVPGGGVPPLLVGALVVAVLFGAVATVGYARMRRRLSAAALRLAEEGGR